MNWGTGIVIAFVCFAGVLATIVTISMKQDVGLVAKDYYKQEIAYQDQIDRKTNYNQLERKPVIKLDASKNHIELPENPLENIETLKKVHFVLKEGSVIKHKKKKFTSK